MELKLMKELIRAKMINAKREKEYATINKTDLWCHWEGQETAYKQLLDILES